MGIEKEILDERFDEILTEVMAVVTKHNSAINSVAVLAEALARVLALVPEPYTHAAINGMLKRLAECRDIVAAFAEEVSEQEVAERYGAN